MLLTIGIMFLLDFMNSAIQFNYEARFVAVEIDDETVNDLLTAEMRSAAYLCAAYSKVFFPRASYRT